MTTASTRVADLIADFGRGPQLATCRITVQDVFQYLRHGYDFPVVQSVMPDLTRDAFDAIVAYSRAHWQELLEKDIRADERFEEARRAQAARGGQFADGDEDVPKSERIERLREILKKTTTGLAAASEGHSG